MADDAATVALLARYAAIIEAHGLCPYLRDGSGLSARACERDPHRLALRESMIRRDRVEHGLLGDVVVMRDAEPDVERAVAAIEAATAGVIHLVYPHARRDVAPPFERFCNAVAARVASRGWVHAAFHPAMTGGREDRDRQIGLLRRSPDPFLQLIPAGTPPKPQPIRDLDAVLAALDELRAAASEAR